MSWSLLQLYTWRDHGGLFQFINIDSLQWTESRIPESKSADFSAGIKPSKTPFQLLSTVSTACHPVYTHFFVPSTRTLNRLSLTNLLYYVLNIHNSICEYFLRSSRDQQQMTRLMEDMNLVLIRRLFNNRQLYIYRIRLEK